MFTILSQVSKAQELLSSECEANIQQTEATGKYLAPEVFKERVPRPYTQPTSKNYFLPILMLLPM